MGFSKFTNQIPLREWSVLNISPLRKLEAGLNLDLDLDHDLTFLQLSN